MYEKYTTQTSKNSKNKTIMIKTLRFTLVALLALVSTASFADKTVTFTAGTENGQYTGSGTPQSGVESITKDGVTIGTSTGAFAAVNYNTKVGEYRIYKSATFTATVSTGAIKKIVFTCTAKGAAKYGPGSFTGDGYTFETDGYTGTWAGNASSVTLTASSNQVRATKIEVTYDENGQGGQGGGGTEQPDQPETVQTVDNIAAFKALADGTTAVLKLNNAVVVYKNAYNKTTEYYVRDASGAIQFYNTGLDLAEGDAITGTVEGKLKIYNGMAELTNTSNTSAEKLTVEKTIGVSPTQVEVSDLLDNKYLADLVVVKGNLSSVTEGSYTNVYVSDGDDQVMVFDKFKTGINIPSDGGLYEIKGVFVSANLSGNITYELSPLSITQVSTGINGVEAIAADANAPMYNIAGQRVSKDYKGLVIMNGKKIMK